MADKQTLAEMLSKRFGDVVNHIELSDMVTVEVPASNLLAVCEIIRDEVDFKFDMLLDVCGVDYQDYGISQWRTHSTTETGFSRGVDEGDGDRVHEWAKSRFASVYHLLSVKHNHRLRIKVFLDDEQPTVPSVVGLWPSANWYEREAYDLYGIVYDGHPDLRRLLTDYGFHGHPFRKDFPLIGKVELRYDEAQKRCVYEPVSIQPRVTVPKVIRTDNRYIHPDNEEGDPRG